jgi:hypothetical protein
MTDSAFAILRAALFEHAREHLESDMRALRPDPEYQAHMRATLRAIRDADSVEALAAIDWVQGMAAMGADTSRYDADIPNL